MKGKRVDRKLIHRKANSDDELPVRRWRVDPTGGCEKRSDDERNRDGAEWRYKQSCMR
jgi:hypothetical protein